jgi:hypothetical protein
MQPNALPPTPKQPLPPYFSPVRAIPGLRKIIYTSVDRMPEIFVEPVVCVVYAVGHPP